MGSSLSLLLGLRFSRGRRRGGMVSLISVIYHWSQRHERI